MENLRYVWHFMIAEPFTWIFYALFQPTRFTRRFKFTGYWLSRHVMPMFRLIIPMFLIVYPITLLVHALFLPFHLLYADIDLKRFFFEPIFGIGFGIAGGIAFGIAGGIAFNIGFGISIGIVVGIVGGIAFGIAGNITGGIAGGIAGGIIGSSIFCILVGIFLGSPTVLAVRKRYLGFLLYLISCVSLFRVANAKRSEPTLMLYYLQISSLHRNERIYLPLPYLKRLLLQIYYEGNKDEALEEIMYIATKQPSQIRVARATLTEIAIHDLEGRTSIVDIAGVAMQLDEFFPQGAKLLDPGWSTTFGRLHDVSEEAVRYSSPVGRSAKLDALARMTKSLKTIYPTTVIHNAQLSNRLQAVVNKWLDMVEQERQQLERVVLYVNEIENPYNPGGTLRLQDPLFKGRQDLVMLLETSLLKGKQRPTFLMNGERRMGKSSTLLQLPDRLGAQFVTVFFDLQNPGILADTMTLLDTISEGIVKGMQAKKLRIEPSVYRMFGALSASNEAYAYTLFNEWLGKVENVLDSQERTLLLLFDEFEKLGEARTRGNLDLSMLLDWFRSIIQHHPRVALLFSGVRNFSEMGSETGVNWPSYFVNVQTLRVSSLHSDEARRLIKQPIPDYPGETVYGAGVVDEIMLQTACHPFLVQAVCSALIDNLNVEKKGQADVPDVALAVDQVFENWDSYFSDLWTRTDDEQRACLRALNALQTADVAAVQTKSGLGEAVVQRTMQALRRRDLVVRDEKGVYAMAAPIFAKWVERSEYI